MSLSIDLTTYGKQLQQTYDKIISSSADTSWAVFSYDKGASNELKVQSTGSGELDEIVDEFSDGRISYGFVRVEDPNTRLTKFVLIGWVAVAFGSMCGEGVPEHRKGLFHSHFLAGYHVQITARSEADLDPATIMNKVADSSGSKYSELKSKFEASPKTRAGPPISPSVSAAFGRTPGYWRPEIKREDDGWGDTPELKESVPTPVKSAYVPTKVDMAALRAGRSDSTSSAPSSTPEIVKSTYTPVGRVDIAAIRSQAKESQPSEPKESSSSYVGTSGYMPVQLPTPRPLVSRFGPTTGRTGTVAPVPTAPARESKAIGGASRNFAADASGKTPSQLWAERKARERTSSGGVPSVTAPQTTLPRAPATESVNKAAYVDDSSDITGKPVSGGVAAMRERFAKQTLDEGSVPISPQPPTRPTFKASPPAMFTTAPSPPAPPSRPSAPSPPPIAMGSKPPPKTYQSLDDVITAGAGAGIGLGVGALAHTEEPEEEEHEVPSPPPPPRPTASRDTWETAQHVEEEEDEDDIATHERSQVHTEQEHEVESPHLPATTHEEPESPIAHVDPDAKGAKTAVVLFDYEAQEENEINLAEGQIITNIEFIDEGWWSGDDPTGHNGLFPSNYVELQEADESSAAPVSTGHQVHHEPEPEPDPEPQEDEGETAIAEYDYEAQEDNELSFPEGAKIIRIERVDASWWAGEYDGKAGLFPANYVNAQ